jgi:hypothetical protein
MADVASLGPFRIDDQLALGIEEREKWQPGISPSQVLHQSGAACIFELFVLFRFLNDHLNGYEIALKNGFDLLMLDKLIEPLAPPSPGGAEINEDAFVLLRGFRFCFGHQLIGGRRARCPESEENCYCDQIPHRGTLMRCE